MDDNIRSEIERKIDVALNTKAIHGISLRSNYVKNKKWWRKHQVLLPTKIFKSKRTRRRWILDDFQLNLASHFMTLKLNKENVLELFNILCGIKDTKSNTPTLSLSPTTNSFGRFYNL